MDDFSSLIDEKITKGSISKWETGKYLPNNKRLKRIAELGEISVSELVGSGEKIESPNYSKVIHLEDFLISSNEIYVKGNKVSKEKLKNIIALLS